MSSTSTTWLAPFIVAGDYFVAGDWQYQIPKVIGDYATVQAQTAALVAAAPPALGDPYIPTYSWGAWQGPLPVESWRPMLGSVPLPSYDSRLHPPGKVRVKGVRLIPHVRGGAWTPRLVVTDRNIHFVFGDCPVVRAADIDAAMLGQPFARLSAFNPDGTRDHIIQTLTYDHAHVLAANVPRDSSVGPGVAPNNYLSWWVRNELATYHAYTYNIWPYANGGLDVLLPGSLTNPSNIMPPPDGFNGYYAFYNGVPYQLGSGPDGSRWRANVSPGGGGVLSGLASAEQVTVTPYDIDVELDYAPVAGKYLAIEVLEVTPIGGGSYIGFDMVPNDAEPWITTTTGDWPVVGSARVPIPSPSVRTDAASDVGLHNAVLHGEIDIPAFGNRPGGSYAYGGPGGYGLFEFEYGKTTAYGSVVPVQGISSSVDVTKAINQMVEDLGQLEAETTYHFRVRVTYPTYDDSVRVWDFDGRNSFSAAAHSIARGLHGGLGTPAEVLASLVEPTTLAYITLYGQDVAFTTQANPRPGNVVVGPQVNAVLRGPRRRIGAGRV